MRLRVAVTTTADEIPWRVLQKPGRPIVYDILGRVAPRLGALLHADGWGPHRMVPFGHGVPVFPSAVRRRKHYSAGGFGYVEFGSPVPEVVEALALGLRQRELLDWGGVALRITGCSAVEPPEFASGRARFRTVTPVVLKGSGRDEKGVRQTRQAWVLPTDAEYPAVFQHNLQRKSETLGFEGKPVLEGISWIGPKRSFAVGGGMKPGAAVEVEISGEPMALQALWSWGLGQANSAGFGWVGA